jgi:NAD(P)-dependent dehydrogenase (short-subunit alcohol dehydrogenase family)
MEAVRGADGEMVSMHPCRLTETSDCQSLIDLAISYGRIDVLYNLAGVSYFNWIEDVSDAEWDRARRNEVDLVFYLTRAAWPHLKASRGTVLNMASLNASLSFEILPSLAHTTNKAGIIGMTRQLAMEGREHGIRANSISPGLIESNATREQLKDPEWADSMLGKTLLGVSAGPRRSRT